MARRDVRGVQGEPSAALFRTHRSPLPNLFVIGGTAADRVAIAGALHRDSRLRGRPFCVTGAGAHEVLLRASLRSWAGPAPASTPLACGGGTLFVDQIAFLPRDLQELLVPLASRLAAESRESAFTGPARLAAGCREDPVLHVTAGRLLPALYETLDKLIIQLGTAPAMTAIA